MNLSPPGRSQLGVQLGSAALGEVGRFGPSEVEARSCGADALGMGSGEEGCGEVVYDDELLAASLSRPDVLKGVCEKTDHHAIQRLRVKLGTTTLGR